MVKKLLLAGLLLLVLLAVLAAQGTGEQPEEPLETNLPSVEIRHCQS